MLIATTTQHTKSDSCLLVMITLTWPFLVLVDFVLSQPAISSSIFIAFIDSFFLSVCLFIHLFVEIDIFILFVVSRLNGDWSILRFSLRPENLMRKMKTSSKKCYEKHAHAFVHQLADKTNDNKLASVFIYLYALIRAESGFDTISLIESRETAERTLNDDDDQPTSHIPLGWKFIDSIYFCNGFFLSVQHFDLINCYGTSSC